MPWQQPILVDAHVLRFVFAFFRFEVHPFLAMFRNLVSYKVCPERQKSAKKELKKYIVAVPMLKETGDPTYFDQNLFQPETRPFATNSKNESRAHP